MNIYEYAMQMEKDGETYYRDLAEKTTSGGIRNILTMLANAEVGHYRIFENMKQQEAIPPPDLAYLATIKNIFAGIRAAGGAMDANVSQIELYRKAQDLEKKTRDFYREKADEADQTQKPIFLKIADEEQKHFNILESIIEMVSRPQNWLENPEWYHLEDY